jgi:hypothetical protein
MSHSQSPVEIVLDPALPDIPASHDGANADAAAASQPPLQDESPFVSSAEAERKQEKTRTAPRPYRTRIAADAKALIDARCESIPGFERHSRKCQICHNRYVEYIEEWYLNWSSAHWIALTFKLGLEDVVYRHARAARLDILRRQNARMVVEKLMEQVDQVTVTSATILRAARALSCMDDQGRWTDPPSTHIVLTSKDLPEPAAVSSVQTNVSSAEVPSLQNSNRGNMKN